MPSTSLLTLAALTTLASHTTALDNGFGRTPPLGYNTYNAEGCSPTDASVRAAIDALAANGLRDAGYDLFQIDCGWQGYDRQSNGSITYDPKPFPNGIRPLSDYAISKRFRWAMYTDQGLRACDTSATPRPGSLGHEKDDAAMFAAWNAVYVKVDNCYIDGVNNAPKDPRTDFPSRYGAMASALQSRGINGMLVCQWGTPYQNGSSLQGPAQWTPPLATSYRVSDDIATGWANVLRIYNEAIQVNLRGLSGPGRFADMDLLEVGNAGMTLAEQRAHFAIWALFKSPLFVSTNVPQMAPQTLQILANKDLLRVNQDPLGAPVTLVQRFADYDLFAGPLSGGDVAVLLVDMSNQARKLTVNFADVGVNTATVKELYSGQTVQNARSYSAAVDGHGAVALRLTGVMRAPTPAKAYTAYEAESATLSGGANIQSCSGCSGGKKAGNISGSSSATIRGIRTSAATSRVRFDYVNCEIGYLAEQGTNTRAARISVNGGPGVDVLFPVSGYDWDKDVLKEFVVELGGFKTQADNTISISGVQGYAPDFDRVQVVR